jgi:hypothetical protein
MEWEMSDNSKIVSCTDIVHESKDDADKRRERELLECMEPIIAQNRYLIEMVQVRGCNLAKELDYTANGAGLLLRRFFEAVAAFEEGTVPWQKMNDLFRTTNELIQILKSLKNAPIIELDTVAVAFRRCRIMWCDNHSPPKMSRKIYLKKIFNAEVEFCARLQELHMAYLRQNMKKGGRKNALSVADVMDDKDNSSSAQKLRVLNEIARQATICGSVVKAIKRMRNGTYSARMRDVSESTWRKYYYDWQREKRRNKKYLKSIKQESANWGSEPISETVKVPNETVNETINTGRETINHGHETINETIKDLIIHRPGVTGKDLVTYVGKSRATVMRIVATLKKAGVIIYRGSKKTGGYYVT